MKYPKQAGRLVQLLKEDQDELKKLSKAFNNPSNTSMYQKLDSTYTKNARKRVDEMLSILQEVENPSISFIGPVASEAIAVIALHSHEDVMHNVLSAFLKVKADTFNDFHLPAIPALQDRTLILQGSKQRFGTQWLLGDDGKPFLYPVENFAILFKIRQEYGIGPLRYPRNSSRRSDTDSSDAMKESDQREPSAHELAEYKKGFI